MTTLERASAEIILLHEQIQAWFRAEASATELDTLIACLADGFQMVTPRGDKQDREAVSKLFARLHGAHVGMTITIDHITLVVEQPDGWLVTYRETQTLSDGSSNRRHAGVWLQPTSAGRPRWIYLQETPLN